MLKSFYNDTKVPLIPSLLVNNKIGSDFTKKGNLFNDFFATQCTPLTNSSVLPSKISFKIHLRLNSFSFEKEDILKIIRNLNVNKAHGHDDISIRMFKMCNSEVVEPLSHQPGFRPNDSCIHQLISIVHNIYADFAHNASLEVGGNFLDISKEFDNVWHERLLYKLESLGISGNLLNLLRSFLNDKHQRVVLNGQLSD